MILRRFWRPKCLIFPLFGLARACCANFAQEQQNTVKTGTECTSEVLRDKTKTTKNRYKRRSILLACSNRGQGRLRTSFGCSWAGNLASKTANMAAKTAYLASRTAQLALRRPSRARFCATLTRPRPTRSAQRAPKSVFCAFSSVFGRCFVDFSLISTLIFGVVWLSRWPFLFWPLCLSPRFS